MTARYRRKPVVVEAMQWTDGDLEGLKKVREFCRTGSAYLIQTTQELEVWVERSQTWDSVKLGGWLVRDPDEVGVCTCSRAVFEATYEPVDGGD